MDNDTQKPENLEQRLAILEKTEKGMADNLKWGVDILKWGLGLFTLIAIAFGGFNWWTAKRNYDSDKESFEKRLTLLTQQFSTDSDKQMTELRKQTEFASLSLSNAFLSLSNNFQNQFVTLQTANSANISNAYLLVTSNIVTATVIPMQVISSNNEFRFMAFVTNVNNVLSNRDAVMNVFIQNALGLIQTNVNEHMAVSLGYGYMLRGSITMGRPKLSRGIDLANATYSYIVACRKLYEGHDEVNLQRCLLSLGGSCLPELVNKNSKSRLMLLATSYELASELKFLIADLKAGNVNRRYDDSITSLEMFLQILEGKVPPK
jgi:hypothetical protein